MPTHLLYLKSDGTSRSPSLRNVFTRRLPKSPTELGSVGLLPHLNKRAVKELGDDPKLRTAVAKLHQNLVQKRVKNAVANEPQPFPNP